MSYYTCCPRARFLRFPPRDSLSAQVIMRGTRSAGYGFVALNSAEAAEKAVEALNKQELDGRPIIVEVAKPAEEKDKEKKEKKVRTRRPGRRGAKAVPGEVTEAEANGEADKADGAAPAAGDAEKPKKKKKKPAVSAFVPINRLFVYSSLPSRHL